jgi:hypothetical protein
MDSASRTEAAPAAEFRSREIQIVAKDPKQRSLRIGVDALRLAIYGEGDRRQVSLLVRFYQ